MKNWIVETQATSRRIYFVQAEDEKEAIFFSTQVAPETDEDEFEETISVTESSNISKPASDASPRGEAVKIVPRHPTDEQVSEILYNINRKRRGPTDLLASDAREVIDNLFFVTAHPAPATVEMREADIARWKRDSELLSAIQDECWDVRFTSTPNADAGDYNVNIEIVGHFMADPQERVVGENYNENLRAALEQAMTADAYPPARPVYDEPAALAPATEGRKG